MKESMPAPNAAELLDIVDVYGEPTGQVADKATVHARGLRHRDVHVWITNGRDTLQQQRNEDKSIMPGAWDVSAAGHVAAGESYRAGAVRETQEELGLLWTPDRFKRIGLVATQMMLPGWDHPHNIVGDNFVIYEPDLSLDDLHLQAEEVQGARWYPIDQLECDLMHPETAQLHVPQPRILYALGIAGMRGVTSA